ncbi:hypothetical protein ALC53_01520 [Atta colombica]|uniref:Uncharacterized protein n=1 Tax=Atta colombica TaxID=520822 RepID=A0A195BUM7_9HYME|nr:hypothetical protein ALC53_01520 [Atta colombica]
MIGSGPAEKMGLKELEAHTRRSTFEEEKDSGRSGQVVSRVQFADRRGIVLPVDSEKGLERMERDREIEREKGVRSNRAYTRVTYPNVCGPHRAM